MKNRRKTPLEIEAIEPEMCSVDLRLEILTQVPFFADLSATDIEVVNRQFVEFGYSPGEMIYLAGDQAERLYVVAEGKIKLLRYTPAGQAVMLDVLTPGEFFGSLAALGENEYPDTAQALVSSCVLSIETGGFRKILQKHPSVAVKVVDIMAERLKAAHEMVQQLSASSAEQRIAHVLRKLAAKLGERKEVGLLIQLPLSRADLAEMAGTTTETASRMMSQFQKEGFIQTGRQWVAIRDLKALEDLVDIP